MATYLWRWQNSSVLQVNRDSLNIGSVMEKLRTKLKVERQNQKPIWTGITKDDNGHYCIWVSRYPTLSHEGKPYTCKLPQLTFGNPVIHHQSMEYSCIVWSESGVQLLPFIDIAVSIATEEGVTSRMLIEAPYMKLQSC